MDLTPDLRRLTEYVKTNSRNGIIGDIRNYDHVDGALMFERMLTVAREDIAALLSDNFLGIEHDPGTDAW